uniref:MIF4G domain-containing protein n=1 Tax=viral metagenome TaxID=1070528 RepID=A0A6C0IIA0_9ZZZZ
MTNVIKFTPSDFERIKNNGFSCTLSPETIAIIQALADQVGAPEYIKTPQFIKMDIKETQQQQNKKRRGGPKSYELNDEAWDTVRNFKTTLIVKKEGMGAVIDQIRKHLNKMTAKTYDTLRDNIIKEIATITEGVLDNMNTLDTVEDEEFVTEISKIGEALFTIASGNSFYSNMYAKLYKELMAKFAFMQTIFETNFNKFNTLFNDFTYCDPNKDYDQFCLNNKVNEKRRALSLFYVNLMKEKLIASGEIEKILQQLQTNLMKAIKEPEQKNIVDEMTEIMFIIIVNGYQQLKEVDEWSSIEDFINLVATLKPTSYPSITNKTIFKFMDILDTL